MPLQSGSRLGPYEIVGALGAGGMGEVYRARDSRLGRDVAIKTLPGELATDEMRLRRFEHEARAASALNHPNILSVFDVGSDHDIDYLVTELVAGVTLRERLGGGALGAREVVDIGAQIADGLAAAHTAGLVHRDVKPENVMITGDGRVKILDFGLAKPLIAEASAQATRTIVSHPGMVVGTIGYVSPEQVRGGEVDARSDIFSLGLVLYEMTAGQRPFNSPTTVETLNAILKEDAPELPAGAPAGLRQIITHCLEKNSARRFQTASDVAFALRSFATTTTTAQVPAVGAAVVRPVARRAGLWIGGMMAVAGLLAAGAWLSRALAPRSIDLNELRLEPFATDAAAEFDPTWSPDGKSVAYVRVSEAGDSQVVVRGADSPAAVVLARGLGFLSQVFWARDGSRVFFGSRADGLRSVSAVGGAVRTEFIDGSGGDMSPDGRTLAAWRLTAASAGDEAALWVGTPGGPLHRYEPPPVIIRSRVGPNVIRFSPDGRSILLWVTGGEPVVWLLPAREGTGEKPRRLFDGHVGSIATGASWLPDSRHIVVSLKDGLWLGDTRDASLVKLMGGTRPAFSPSVSPDGTRVLFTEQVENYDVIELSLKGGSPRVLVGTSQYDGSGVWAPKGGRLAYATRRGGAEAVWTRTGEEMSDQKLLGSADVPGSHSEYFKGLSFSPDGAWLSMLCAKFSPTLESRVWIVPARGGAPRPITPAGTLALSASWAPDGSSLAVNMVRNGRLALWIASLDGGSEPRLVRLPPDTEVRSAEWSPTGEWIAAIMYVSGTVPRPTLLIRPDGSETRTLPSLDSPALVWAADGRTLYGVSNRSGTSELTAVDLAAGTVRTVANYGVRLDLADSLGGMLRFTLGPDHRSFVTTAHTDQSDVWMLTGLR